MDKYYTSNVEFSREKFEEPQNIIGRVIKSNQIWRDSNLIPTAAPSYENMLSDEIYNDAYYKAGTVYSVNDGATIINLIQYFSLLPLDLVSGTNNCYSSELLKNIILEDFGSTYIPKIYVDSNLLSYGVGQPIFDSAAGTLYFCDNNFANKIKNKNIYISFYKYTGRFGTSSSNNFNNADLPYRDTIPHFKNSSNNSQTATIKVAGDIKNTNYTLPPNKEKWYDKENSDTGVFLLQETLENTLWMQDTIISGGKWLFDNNNNVIIK